MEFFFVFFFVGGGGGGGGDGLSSLMITALARKRTLNLKQTILIVVRKECHVAISTVILVVYCDKTIFVK